MKPSHSPLRNLDPHRCVQWGVLTTFSKSHFLRSSNIDPQRCIETFTSTTFVLLCIVGSRIFGLVYFKLHSTGRYSCITAAQLLLYSQHWTRLANSQTNTIPRLELPKHGLQGFFEGHPHILEQNFLWQRCRELLIMLCACGPVSVASNEWFSLLTTTYAKLTRPGVLLMAKIRQGHQTRHRFWKVCLLLLCSVCVVWVWAANVSWHHPALVTTGGLPPCAMCYTTFYFRNIVFHWSIYPPNFRFMHKPVSVLSV